MEKAIYKMNFDCGRMGSLEGIFVSEKIKMNELITSNKEVYFGEVLGKHSEILGPIDADDIRMVSDNPEVIKIFEENEMETGHNPFDYIDQNV